jgi:hypothetical protein
MSDYTRFVAIPLADKGFYAVDEFSNPVRWYVEDTGLGRLWVQGPYADADAAEAKAEQLNNGTDTPSSAERCL